MDIHEAARAIAPETFAVYDPLSRQVDLLRERLALSKAEQQAAIEASAPHQAEIADLRDRLDDPATTPRLAKKYQARLDDLEPQRDAFLADQDHVAELMRDTPEQQSLRRLLLETDYQMRDLAPEVTAAYREAAKRFPETQVEAAASAAEPAAPAVAAESAAAAAGEMPGTAEPVTGTRAATTEAAAPSPPIEPTTLSSEATEGAAGAEPSLLPVEATPAAGSEGAERTTPTPINIREDQAAKQTDVPQDIRRTVAAKLMAAGRPEDEARASAELVAAGYETRAARFGGARGTGAELYAAEAPDVVAGQVGSRTPAMELAQRRARTLQQAFRPRFAVQWTRDLDSLKAGTLSRGSDLALGPTPEALKAAGLPDLPLVLKQGEARKIVLEKHAGTIDEETLRRLPDALRDPILVFRQANGRLGVLLNDGRGSDVLAVVQPDTVVGNRRVNKLVTVHTKSSPISIMEAIRDGRVTYRDEGRSQNWFDQAPDQSRGREPNPGFSGLITTKEDLVKRLGSTYWQTTRGKININNAGSVITLMRDANASTFMHETGHDWLEKLLADAKHPAAPDQIVADSKTVRTWLGAEPDAEITRAQHEKFARGFERYLMEGIAPSRGLERVFAQFKQWLTKIYQTVTRLRAPINDDIRAVFDRMPATPEERAVIASDRVLSGPALGGRELSGSVEPNSPYLKPGKEPTRLVAFLRRKTVENPGTIHEMTVPGGLRDPGGDIRAMIGGSKGMPGLINNATGRTIHDALIRAWEHGYFPEHGEHWGLEDNDLLRKGIVQAAHDEALSAVLMKRPAYGTGQQKLDSIVNNSLPLKLAMPFMQVGMNILDEGLIKNTPLTLASPTVRDERRTLRPAGDSARVAQRAVGWLG